MSFRVKVLADSITEHGDRLFTIEAKYPRLIHSEVMTHRALSKNAASSRAIPVERMIKWVEDEPAGPDLWGKNQKGMRADRAIEDSKVIEAASTWLSARDHAVRHARSLLEIGVHKQIANRLLEPFAHMNTIISGTAGAWINLFALRCHKDAQPEFQRLAVMIARAWESSVPTLRREGEWHLPYVSEPEHAELEDWTALRRSVARCCRVSYKTFDDKQTKIRDDIELHDTLMDNGHWSPFEHQAAAAPRGTRSGNFVGWHQYRQGLQKSVHAEFDFATLDQFPSEWV